MSGGESAACCECKRKGRSINRELNQTGRCRQPERKKQEQLIL